MMSRYSLALFLALAFTACGRETASEQHSQDSSVEIATETASRTEPDTIVAPASTQQQDSAAESSTDQSNDDGTPQRDALGAEGAVAVIKGYYAAINSHDYKSAYSYWGDNGRSSNQTFDEFKRGFANTESVKVDVGTTGRIEGAAGSRYITVPVIITARTTDGHDQRFTGTYALRRAVVDGASAEQRQWHIYSADISESK
jgi:hypothetical protein